MKKKTFIIEEHTSTIEDKDEFYRGLCSTYLMALTSSGVLVMNWWNITSPSIIPSSILISCKLKAKYVNNFHKPPTMLSTFHIF